MFEAGDLSAERDAIKVRAIEHSQEASAIVGDVGEHADEDPSLAVELFEQALGPLLVLGPAGALDFQHEH